MVYTKNSMKIPQMNKLEQFLRLEKKMMAIVLLNLHTYNRISILSSSKPKLETT